MNLLQKIKDKQAQIGVVGLGYVGLPLMIEFASNNFTVLGLDIDQHKIEQLLNGESYIRHIDPEKISKFIAQNINASCTTDFSKISQCDIIIICVPTPLNKFREPDLSYVESTGEKISPFLTADSLVILESTTYPGTTEEVLIPLLEKDSELIAGKNLLVAYSPEREDPNNTEFTTSTIPKVVGGFDSASLEAACALYEQVICSTVPVSNCRTAEATKLMENIFRCVNIALVNELKVVFQEMDIDIWEVVNSAKTKPFGYMPFYPGPGLGGHCIPIDPFYLTWKAKEFGLSTKFIELAGEINTSMPDYVIQKASLALNSLKKSINGSNVIIIGLAYKKNVDDIRESPSFALWKSLLKLGANVSYHDPYCKEVPPSRTFPEISGIKGVDFEDINDKNYDLAIISTGHDCVDHSKLVENLSLIVDTRNVCPESEKVIKA